jgi:hypothetical protein
MIRERKYPYVEKKMLYIYIYIYIYVCVCVCVCVCVSVCVHTYIYTIKVFGKVDVYNYSHKNIYCTVRE